MGGRYFAVSTYEDSDGQRQVRRAIESALALASELPECERDHTRLVTLIQQSIESQVGGCVDLEGLLVSNGLFLSLCGTAELLPVLTVAEGNRIIDHSTPTRSHLKDGQSREVIFTAVRLGAALSPGIPLPFGSRALGAYARGCMFIMSGTLAERTFERWSLARALLAARQLLGCSLVEAPEVVASLPKTQPPSVFVEAHYILQVLLSHDEDTRYDSADERPPLEFATASEDDLVTHLTYHEIGGHYVHDLANDQRSVWEESVIASAEGRALLAESLYGPWPLSGVLSAFRRLDSDVQDGRDLSCTDVGVFFAALFNEGGWLDQPRDLSHIDWQQQARRFVSMSGEELRRMAGAALARVVRGI